MNRPVKQTAVSREAFFIGSGDEALYAMAHRPANPNGQAVIYCAPFADDIQRSYRLIYNFFDSLAEAGYLALRFDYRGCGDSAGTHEDSDLTTRLQDINRVTAFAQEKYNITHQALLGLRLGANFACMAAKENDLVKQLILWEPIIDGKKYLYDCLRANIASQMFIYRKVIKNRDQQVAGLSQGEPVNIDGYEINQQMFEAACRINLTEQLAALDLPTLLVNIQAGKRPLPKTTAETMAQITANQKSITNLRSDTLPFWANKKIFMPGSPQLFSQTLDWLKDQS